MTSGGLAAVSSSFFAALPVYRALDFGIGIILGVLSKCKEKKNLDGMLALLLIVYVIMMVVFDKRFTYSIYHVVETLLVWTIVGFVHFIHDAVHILRGQLSAGKKLSKLECEMLGFYFTLFSVGCCSAFNK